MRIHTGGFGSGRSLPTRGRSQISGTRPFSTINNAKGQPFTWTAYGYPDFEPGQVPTEEQAKEQARKKAEQAHRKTGGDGSGREEENWRKQESTDEVPLEPAPISVSPLATGDIEAWLKVYYLLRSENVISDEDETKLLLIVAEVILSTFPAGRAALALRDVYQAVEDLFHADEVSLSDVVNFAQAVKTLVGIAAKGSAGLAGVSARSVTDLPKGGIRAPDEITDKIIEKLRDAVKEKVQQTLTEQGNNDVVAAWKNVELMGKIQELLGG